MEKSLKDLIAETNYSLQNKMNDVKINFNTRLITVQDQVLDIKTDVNNMKMSFGSFQPFQNLINKNFTKVWAKFKEIDKEIANLPKNSGSKQCGCHSRNFIVFCSLFSALLNLYSAAFNLNFEAVIVFSV